MRVLATVRSSATCPPAVDRLRQSTGVDHVELGTMADADIADLVERALGGPLSGHARSVIITSAAGNPMYAREPVSYTHLDVYKRQSWSNSSSRRAAWA